MGMKILIKSAAEEIRQSRKQLKILKFETEKLPCPQRADPSALHRSAFDRTTHRKVRGGSGRFT